VLVDLKVGLILYEISKRQIKRFKAENHIIFKGEELERVWISQPTFISHKDKTLGFHTVIWDIHFTRLP
jgi:hypothetical protein